MWKLDREELIWAAALFEGEGCFSGRFTKGKLPLGIVGTREMVTKMLANEEGMAGVR